MRVSILENTGAPIHVHVPVHGHGRLLGEGVGAGPDHGGPDHVPDLGDPGGDPDLEDPVPELFTLRPQWMRLNSSWSLTSLSFVRSTN